MNRAYLPRKLSGNRNRSALVKAEGKPGLEPGLTDPGQIFLISERQP
jgi:hypothetical protein